MKRSCMAWVALSLVACGRAMPVDSVDSLVAHPDRLKAVMHQCQEDRTKMGEVECMHASEAFRRRFMGDGKGKYTPLPKKPNDATDF
ncbi:hypothetical protein CS053_10815 [Rhodanobacter glycinis]|uniref:Entry exclusion lipoprotein TrbK n=1 Tax=Rhodanobacter glycinis TaxID=582702 RepID=A0A5B9DY29_9GAMM|nr:EexN family lipoprotein [Rhodanobacter glycinis]QEE24933.1 hypothetical protein CS053_10815 [Rhodanobacter glycinis]